MYPRCYVPGINAVPDKKKNNTENNVRYKWGPVSGSESCDVDAVLTVDDP